MLRPGDLVLLHQIGVGGSLAAAAKELGFTPSAITQQVTRMENSVGASLVERGARGARLTELGHLLAHEGALVVGAQARSVVVVDEYLRSVSRRLRVGSLASTVVPVVAEALAHLRLRFPDGDLSVMETGSDKGIEGVRDGDLDVAIVADYGQFSGSDVTLHWLIDDPWVAVVPERHVLARRRRQTIDLRALAEDPWVSGASGRPYRVQQDLVASRFGVEPQVAFETESYEFAQAMVAAGTAVAVIPRLAWHRLPGTVVFGVKGAPTRRLVAVTRRRAGHLELVPPMLNALQQTAVPLRSSASCL